MARFFMQFKIRKYHPVYPPPSFPSCRTQTVSSRGQLRSDQVGGRNKITRKQQSYGKNSISGVFPHIRQPAFVAHHEQFCATAFGQQLYI